MSAQQLYNGAQQLYNTAQQPFFIGAQQPYIKKNKILYLPLFSTKNLRNTLYKYQYCTVYHIFNIFLNKNKIHISF